MLMSAKRSALLALLSLLLLGVCDDGSPRVLTVQTNDAGVATPSSTTPEVAPTMKSVEQSDDIPLYPDALNVKVRNDGYPGWTTTTFQVPGGYESAFQYYKKVLVDKGWILSGPAPGRGLIF